MNALFDDPSKRWVVQKVAAFIWVPTSLPEPSRMQETFYEYRACELKHGRVAMMVSWLFPGASVCWWVRWMLLIFLALWWQRLEPIWRTILLSGLIELGIQICSSSHAMGEWRIDLDWTWIEQLLSWHGVYKLFLTYLKSQSLQVCRERW